jgi:transcriptional regulator GlxA family with amidase domain
LYRRADPPHSESKPADPTGTRLGPTSIALPQKCHSRCRYKNLQVKVQEETDLPIPAETLVLEDAFVLKFKNVLEENYSNPEMSVEILSVKMSLSRAQLYRKLQSLTGRSVNEHLNSIRLEKARHLLKTSSMNISEVAYDVGFNDPKYFGRVFSEAFGQSPSEFAGRR